MPESGTTGGGGVRTDPVQGNGEGGTSTLPLISDATLRDSAHMAGVEFTARHTAHIATLLAELGVNLVEVGMISGAGSPDAGVIEAAHEAIGPEQCVSLVVVRDRHQVVGALDEAVRLGCRSVMLSIPTSADHAGLKLASRSDKFLISVGRAAVAAAKDRGLHVTFSGEDAARTDRARLLPYVEEGFRAGADRFRLAETVACRSSRQMGAIVRELADIDGSEIEIHSHNMLGMAVANSLAAYESGAAWISATVGGIGERGGNAPLAEVLTALRVIYGDARYDLSRLTALTATALDMSALGPAFMAGPTTSHAFAYELVGQLTHPDAYETVPPETVGNRRGLRVRSRLNPGLLSWAIGPDTDVDTGDFCSWLEKRQSDEGNPILDRNVIHKLADEFRSEQEAGQA